MTSAHRTPTDQAFRVPDGDASGRGRLAIGEFSRLSLISVRMLRYYDDKGLLKPARVDRDSGYRYYTGGQLERAAQIRTLRDLGCPVADIAELLPLFADPTALRTGLEHHRARLEGQARRLAEQIDEVATLSQRLKEQTMSITVTEIEVPRYVAAAVRDIIPGFSDEGVLWDRLMRGIAELGIEPAGAAGPPLATATFHDEEYRERDVDVEVRIQVATPFADGAGVSCVRVDAHRAITAIHRGGYDGISAVMSALGAAITERGLSFAGPMYNVYLVGPESSPDPADWVTDVRIPVIDA